MKDLERAREIAVLIAGDEGAQTFLDEATREVSESLSEPDVAEAVEAIRDKLLERGRLEGWRARLAIAMSRRRRRG
jgi:molybdopterin converting factor small subunit